MINENLSKFGEFGIWLIQWFGDFSKDIKVLQIRTLNLNIRLFITVLLENGNYEIHCNRAISEKFVFIYNP